MICSNCGTEIADKALICYRCGTATTAPRIPPPVDKPGRGPVPLVIALILLAAAALFVPPEVPDGQARLAAWAGLALLTALAVWGLRPRPRRRRRR